MNGKPPALTEPQVDEIVAAYDGGNGTPIPVLARQYDVAPASVRYRLNQRGVLASGSGPVQSETTETVHSLIDSSFDEPRPAAPDMSSMANDPAIKGMIEQLVADRLAEMMAQASPQVAAPAATSDQGFANVMGRMLEILSMQQPGYQRPLAADEMETRLAGKVEMEALLAGHKAAYERNPHACVLPKWRVGEKGFFECVDAIELQEGNKFSTYLPPVEDFEPLNAEAEAVMAAMLQWLGGHTPDIGETVKNAHLAANERVIVPGAMVSSIPKGPLVNVEREVDLSEPARPRKRQFGTLVEEPRQITGGTTSEPIGPAYEAA